MKHGDNSGYIIRGLSEEQVRARENANMKQAYNESFTNMPSRGVGS